jgi:hypothetical protein
MKPVITRTMRDNGDRVGTWKVVGHKSPRTATARPVSILLQEPLQLS